MCKKNVMLISPNMLLSGSNKLLPWSVGKVLPKCQSVSNMSIPCPSPVQAMSGRQLRQTETIYPCTQLWTLISPKQSPFQFPSRYLGEGEIWALCLYFVRSWMQFCLHSSSRWHFHPGQRNWAKSGQHWLILTNLCLLTKLRNVAKQRSSACIPFAKTSYYQVV